MSRRHLTPKQQDFLKYIRDYVSNQGVWPTYREMSEHFEFRSPNSVTQNLLALNKKGFLLRDEEGYRFPEDDGQAVSGIPIKGVITAGRLQEAVAEDLGVITLSMIFPQLDRIFAIRVSGSSMEGEDIFDGDYVLLMDDEIPNGEIGAILYNGETSLKRVFYDEFGLRLEPSNSEFSDIHIRPDVFEEVRVLGRYVGHVNSNGIFSRVRQGVVASAIT